MRRRPCSTTATAPRAPSRGSTHLFAPTSISIREGFLESFRVQYNLRNQRWRRHKGTSAHLCLIGQRVEDWLRKRPLLMVMSGWGELGSNFGPNSFDWGQGKPSLMDFRGHELATPLF